MADKINRQAGESLIESLSAILIFTFGSIALLTMLSAAKDINQQVRREEKSHRQKEIRTETASGTPSGGTIRLQLGERSKRIPVSVFGDEVEGYVFFLESIDGN